MKEIKFNFVPFKGSEKPHVCGVRVGDREIELSKSFYEKMGRPDEVDLLIDKKNKALLFKLTGTNKLKVKKYSRDVMVNGKTYQRNSYKIHKQLIGILPAKKYIFKYFHDSGYVCY